MMARDDRFYAFIVAHTSNPNSRVRRISLHKRWVKACAWAVAALLGVAAYGIYGFTQQASHLRVAYENERLRAENDKQRQQLNSLNQRVEAVENVSRRIAETAGVEHDQSPTAQRGAGGPGLPFDAGTALEYRTKHIEQDLRTYEAALHARAMTPSIWPVSGELTDGFGGRSNPFGGGSFEFHTGQDIATLWGTPVMAAASGKVIFAGWQNGYGQIVIVDHGGGLTTRYGHLSHVDVIEGQKIGRGEPLGRVGSTGRSTGPHLHYEVRINDEPVNPRQYLPHNTD
ncbi:MAG: peptidoglycan DD-metalloendopeptidase family protein [Acidobacteria bacterium]|nr:peptidoglycan DD-metalloendopeptidase family protein [Acidobacteriota bacterium]